ncbi:MAG: Glutamine-dependent synthetase [Pseudomonadota bacterium]|jgi:NAD+ synthase (glutamine-hydrolysing)
MNRLTVAAVALNQIPLSWDDNAMHIRQAIAAAKKAGAQVVCLPELCVPGYGCEDAFHAEGVLVTSLEIVQKLAGESKGLVVNFGVPLAVQGAVYNTVAVAINGSLRGFVAKQHLAGDGIHYEPRWFKPWPRGVVSSVEVDGKTYPVGDIFFDVDGLRIGFEICEDAWVAERPGIFLAKHGVDIILNPSASHFAFGKHEIRKRFVTEGSRACGTAYVYANLLGCEAGRIIYDGDTLICSHGELVARGERFSYQDFTVTTGVVDIDRSRLLRRRTNSFRPEFDAGERCVGVRGFSLKRASRPEASSVPSWEESRFLKYEEFSRAVALGLFDYLRKSGSEGFVVSLSGGVDSSAASVLVALMVQAATQELGISGFRKKLGYISWMPKAKNEREIISKMLACVYQATRNSSQITHQAALALAKEIGADSFDLDIDPLVRGYTSLIEKELGTTLSWEKHDLPLQNIQARVRAPSVWLIANLRRALLLTTSNRSEAAVGYTTMDGDSSGGLSPLGGIDKAFLREWLRWMETTGPTGLRSFSTLRLVNAQEPTAELRPLAKKQTDEGDLMPYEVLDVIERLAIRDKRMPVEVYDLLREHFGTRFSTRQLAHWISRFYTLWSVNQWKRERYAPSFHLDDENLDPKTWCRFPILSGGFTKELEALQKRAGVKRKRS